MRTLGKWVIIGALAVFSLDAVTAEAAAPAAAGKVRRMGRADTNADGMVSRQEYIADAEGKFKARDINNDGVITREESRAFRDKALKARAASKKKP